MAPSSRQVRVFVQREVPVAEDSDAGAHDLPAQYGLVPEKA